MKKVLGYILFGVFISGCLTGMFFLVRKERAVRNEISCNLISVEIPDTSRFITQETAYDIIRERFDPVIGTRITDIDLTRIEKTFEAQECIRKAEVWVTDDGILHIRILQKVPELRFTGGGREFYVDGDGQPFSSLNPQWCANVPCISGDVSRALDKKWMADMLKLSACLGKDPLCKERIRGYETDAMGYVSIILHGGTVVLAGTPEKHGEISEKLGCYIGNIEGIHGISYYKKVNIKYKNQIVCRKDS